MFQKKKVLVIIVSSVLVIGASAGVYFWHSSSKPSRLARLSMNSSTDSANAGGATSLNVNSTDNLGQLGVNLNQTTNGGQSTGASSQGQTSSSGSSNTSSSSAEQQAQKMMDPSTFTQYNDPKYLNGQSAFYADLQQGTGTEIAAGHEVAVIYKGWLTNGQLFDESKADSNGQLQPFMFEYGANPAQVINGWTEGLSGMKVGGVRLLIVPPAAGYGATGQGPIPGNSVLIFAVQLQAVQ